MPTRADVRRIALSSAGVASILVLVLVLLVTAGCSSGSERAPRQRDSAAPRITTPAGSARPDSTAAPTLPAAASKPAAPTSMTVTERGIGPLRAGMTFAEASAALGGALLVPVEVDTSRCDYLVWDGGPPGVQVMFDQHRIARIDVDTASIATAAGAHVGDDEARIKRLYPQATVTPHKYENGHYLTVIPTPADPRFRIIFETAGGRVTRYRAGMMPSVGYVEGCS